MFCFHRLNKLLRFYTNNKSYHTQPIHLMEPNLLISQKTDLQRVTLDLSLIDTAPAQPIFDCLIILNYKFQHWLLKKLSQIAKIVLITDGGANTLYKTQLRDLTNLYGIVGDLDSIKPEVKEYYQQKNVKIIHDHNQDTNDFQKGIIFAHQLKLNTIVSIGTLGGRIDQELCNLSVIQRYSLLHHQRFVAIGQNSLMFLIRSGEQAHIKIGKHCIPNQAGFVSFGKSKVETQGFKWNLSSNGPQLEWGKLISSSNVIEGNEAIIRTQNQIFFTIQLQNIGEQ